MSGIASFKNLKKGDLLNRAISLILKELPDFKNSCTYNAVLSSRKNEDQHSMAFCIHMNAKSHLFTFMNQAQQKHNRTVDIAVVEKSSSQIVLLIESKMLPTPIASNRSTSEYVYAKEGHLGAGIQRFKEAHHGYDWNEKLMDFFGMIGFITEQDFRAWENKINSWIQDAGWGKAEFLKFIEEDKIASLLSKHKRINKDEFSIQHFWVKVY